MFYSRTILAKKSPLGTVWIAAHLEQRIKKTQIEGIDIPSYADCIMFPEVPIALRLSGHLLLGLVRIYSRKVTYLFQDCNRMVTDIRTVFTSVRVDLPIDADHAPFETITKPNTFDLDALELDDSIDLADGPDKHLKTYDQITIEDQNPVEAEAEPYVTILINEDDRLDTASGPENFNSGASVMEEDVFPPFDGTLEDFARPLGNVPENVPDVGDPGPSNPGGVSVQNLNEGSFSYEFPEIEVMRDAVHNTETENLSELNDTLSHNLELHEQSAPSMDRRDILSPIMEGPSVSRGVSPSLPVHDISTSASADALDIPNTGISLGHQFPDVELQPSPPVRRRAKRKKEEIDTEIVLTNAVMKKQLQDPSKLVCKRRKLPDTVLDLSRHARTRDCTFLVPLISGMSDNLLEVFERSYPSTSESASFEASASPLDVPDIVMEPAIPETEMEPAIPETEMEPAIPETEMEPATHETEMETARDQLDMEPEIPRFGGNNDGVHCDLMPSPSRGGEFTPLASKNLESASERGNTFETEVFDIPASETVRTELETPLFNWGEELHMDDTDQGRNYTLLNSGEVEELNFLEASNASPGSDVIKVENMSARTRAVAQYLKEHSPASQTSEEEKGFLNLNKILETKTRRKCARMLFETLVLKSCRLIDVKQEEAYGDILISPTPELLSSKF